MNPVLDASQTQVLFADLQPQIVARSKTAPPREIAKSAAVLAELAELFGLPVTISVVPESEKPPELIPELAAKTAGQPSFTRTAASLFFDTPTRAVIDAHNRLTLVLAGCMTEVVVLRTALDALAAGYKVFVPVDACGGMSDRTEAAALRQIEAAGGVPTAVVSLATAWEPDFGTERGQKMFAVIQQVRLG